MKNPLKYFLFCLVICSCKANEKTKCLIIDDFDNNHIVFPLDNRKEICLGNFEFLKTLPVGFIVPNSAFSISQRESIPFVKALNSERNERIYGNSDKYYTIYVAHFEASSYSLDMDQMAVVHLKIANKSYSFKIVNAQIDSVCVGPIK
jgi:hypothetical protein